VTGRVEVFDGSFTLLHRGRDDDDDAAFHLPGLGRDWSPFNIQNVGGSLVVTFAHRAPGSTDEDHGAGLGFVGVFDLEGRLLLRLQHGSWFNAPWGVALAPADFGKFSHRLLIANFGDGTINAFNITSGKHEGTVLADATRQPLIIDGLWALGFGGISATNNGASATLFFTAGPNDEADGLFGTITVASTPSSRAIRSKRNASPTSAGPQPRVFFVGNNSASLHREVGVAQVQPRSSPRIYRPGYDSEPKDR